MDTSPSKKEWELNQNAWDKLLLCLDPSGKQSAEKYEIIRRKLITFFENRGGRYPEELADETINRVARKLEEGKEIYTADPASYFYGVARNVIQEEWEVPKRNTPVEDGDIAVDPEEEKRREQEKIEIEQKLECLEQCKQALSPQARNIITEYYQGEQSVKIKNRKKLAESLGIQINALRIRALRIREKLEECFEDCQKRSSKG